MSGHIASGGHVLEMMMIVITFQITRVEVSAPWVPVSGTPEPRWRSQARPLCSEPRRAPPPPAQGDNDKNDDDDNNYLSVSPAPPLVSSSGKLSPASPAQPEELIMEIKRLRDRSVEWKIRSHLSEMSRVITRWTQLLFLSSVTKSSIHLWNKFN